MDLSLGSNAEDDRIIDTDEAACSPASQAGLPPVVARQLLTTPIRSGSGEIPLATIQVVQPGFVFLYFMSIVILTFLLR